MADTATTLRTSHGADVAAGGRDLPGERGARASGPAFVMLLVYISLLFLRPQEWFRPMYGWRVVLPVAILTIGLTLLSLSQRRGGSIITVPQDWLMLGFYGAILMSHVAHTYLDALIEHFQSFGRIVLLYFLIVLLVTRLNRLKAIIFILVLGGLLMSWHGILQAQRGYGFGGDLPMFRPLLQHGVTVRVRWVGFFHDPNDLALMLVAILPFLFSKVIAKRALLPSRVLAIAACVPILYTIYLTNSRGGWLALAVMVGVFIMIHMKHRKVAFIMAGLAFWAFLAIGPDRLGISDDASARQRIALWGTGNRLLKRWPLFGAGRGRFTEFSQYSQVAHNSFIHCWAELGMVGYFFWLSLLLAVVKDNYVLGLLDRRKPPEEPGREPEPRAPPDADTVELARFGRAMLTSLAGFVAASFFLTRTYVIPLYVLCALGAAGRSIYEQRHGPLPGGFARKDLKLFAVITVLSVPAMWLTIRVLN